MEENAETTEGKGRIICPSLVITSSIKVAPPTRRLMKCLSALMGVPIIHRGKSNLDEIAYYVKRAGYKSFVVVYSRAKRPSLLSFYRLRPEGYFERYGCIVLKGVEFIARPSICIGFNLVNNGKGEISGVLWRFITNLFHGDACEGFLGRICRLVIDDSDSIAVMRFWDGGRKVLELEVKRVVLSKEKQT